MAHEMAGIGFFAWLLRHNRSQVKVSAERRRGFARPESPNVEVKRSRLVLKSDSYCSVGPT